MQHLPAVLLFSGLYLTGLFRGQYETGRNTAHVTVFPVSASQKTSRVTAIYAPGSKGWIAKMEWGDSVEVMDFINRFLVAFRTLDWPRFYDCFAEDATAFFPPSARFSHRANNKEAIGAVFKRVFENARKNKPAPPYLDIEPKELNIQLFGETAIVSFVLQDPGMLGRRTLVLKKNQGSWQIIHLHASGIPADSPGTAVP